MVLYNFECWAVGGDNSSEAAMELPFGVASTTRHANPFNPRELQQAGIPTSQPTLSVSHISSNGYYGFSYVNAAHEINNNNNNNNDFNNNNNNLNNNNNRTIIHKSDGMGNDVNGMQQSRQREQPQNFTSDVSGQFGTVEGPTRCKRRYFVSADDYDDCDDASLFSGAGSGVTGDRALPSKRCRFDDDYAAQYCNDFFSLPSTQIGTQAGLMDTDDFNNSREIPTLQQQQQQMPQTMNPTTISMMTTTKNNAFHTV